jgi:hypothetical protein
MGLKARLRSTIKAQRKRGALWVRLLDLVRLFSSGEGRALLWTRLVHRAEVHQTTPYTCDERYPALFDLAATLAPDAHRILSFGCSTGEELIALRRRFPRAEIIGAEINPRSRRIAVRRVAKDARIVVVHPRSVQGIFDLVFALAVLQREPHKIVEMEVEDLSSYYPYVRFDTAVRQLGGVLATGGLLFVMNAQYRVEDSSLAWQFEPISSSPLMDEPLFGPEGRLLERAVAHTIFRKR